MCVPYYLQNSVGFRLDVKPQTTGGELFNFEGGVQSLNLEDDGRLTYQVFTENGMASVSSSAAVSLNAWHTVAGKYKDGTLILEVNGVVSETQVVGKLEYSVTNRGLTIGENFTGRLSSVKLYNYDNAPLVTFSDGSTQTTQTFAVDTYEDAVQVISNGQLNTQTEQATTYRIGLTANINTGDDAGKTQDYFIGVVSKAYYGQLASLYIDAAKPEGYPIVSMNAYQRSPLVPFMGVAHAGFVDWIADNAFDTLVSAIGFLIPYEEGIGLVKQVYYLATGDDDFDSLELTLNALGVASFIPILKPLLPLTKALKGFLRPLKASNPKFIKAIGGVMGKVTDDLLSGKLTTIIQMAPFLIIAGEMLSDEEARQGLMVMVNSIASTDDMFAWIDYLRLPADGWEGDGEPPEVELSASVSVSVDEVEDGFSPFGLMMGKAYAAKPKKIRIKGDFGKAISKMAEDLGASFKSQSLIQFVKTTVKALKTSKIENLRKYVTNPKFLVMGVGMTATKAAKNFKTFLKGESSSRIKPQIMIGVVWYLEKSMNNGSLGGDDGKLQFRIRGIYGNAFTSVFSKGTNLTPQAHGGMYHLAKIAQYHFQSETLSNFPKIKAVEAERTVQFYTSDDFGGESAVDTHIRKPDIILAPDINSTKEIWVELKSYSNKRGFKVWQYAKTGGAGSIGKELIVDRAANVRAPSEGVWFLRNDGEKIFIDAVDNRWRFQVFNVKPTKKRQVTPMWSYSPAQFEARLKKMNEFDNHEVIRTTLKTKSVKFKASSVAKMDTISTWFIDSGSDILDSLQ